MHPSQISLVTCELDGLIQHLEELSEAYSSVFIISDSRIESAYRSQFDRESPAWKWITLSEGEMAKSLREVVHAWQDLASAHADRGSLVIGLGGGAVCDVAGFVAATYMRGIDIIQVPTTLLAMVDASVGGKTAIDFAGEKNLIGAFKVPIGVFICPHFLDSLDERQFRAGLAEIIKHAVIAGEEHRLALEENMGAILAKDTAVLREVIELSVRVKGDVVERDPLEKGHRALLNYGHTFGHAIEQLSPSGILHGEAVAIGMSCAAWLSRAMGFVDDSFVDSQERLLIAAGLSTQIPDDVAIEAIVKAMQRDKKAVLGQITCVLAHAWGDVQIHKAMDPDLIAEVLQQKREAGKQEEVEV